MAQSTIREKAIETLELEAKAVARLTERIDADFESAVMPATWVPWPQQSSG